MAENKFSNPLKDDEDREATVGAVSTAIFDDDAVHPTKVSQNDSTDRRRERVNAQSVQQFVEEQIFGEATLDDLDDDPDLELHKSKCFGLLHPRTTRSQVYDMIQMVALWYIVAMVPWRIAFEISTSYPERLWFVDIAVDLLIVFDIVLNLKRYYFDPATHQLITDGATVRKEYMSGWFLIDCLSIFPFDYMIRTIYAEENFEVTPGSSTKLIRLARLARFARLFRLTKLANLRKFSRIVNNQLRKIGVSKPGMEFVGRISFLAGVVLLTTHVVACLWINISREKTLREVGPTVVLEAQDGQNIEVYDNWFARHYLIGDAETCKTLFPDREEEKCDDPHDRVNQLFGIQNSTTELYEVFLHIYIDAAYFILTTMSTVGFGDILPYNSEERVFCTLVIMVGTFVWAYIVGSFSSTLQNLDRDKNKFDEEMRSIKAMMRFHEVPDDLADRMDAFFEYKFESHTMFDDQRIMDMLPTRIRTDYILHRFRHVINMIPFFRGCREDVVIEIVTRLKSFSVLPADYLFRIGDPYVELCVLTKGRMAIVHEKQDGEEIMDAEYFKGAFFGESEFLGFGKERTATIRARTFCEVSTLHPEDMESVLRNHVKLRRRLDKYAKLKMEMEKGLKEMGSAANAESMMKMKAEIEESWVEDGKEVEEAWGKMAKNENGHVSRDLLGDLSGLLGRPLKEWELDNAMHVMDTDDSGFIDYEEFEAWWEAGDATLSFSGRNPQDDFNRSMKTMSEATLGLLHDVLHQVGALTKQVDEMQRGR